MQNSKVFLPLFFISVVTLSPYLYAGGTDKQMENIILEMENSTPAGKFETQRRSGWQGGTYTYKTRAMSINLATFQAPSARGGCNGFDMQGGSFSFVSEDQIVAFLKTIASNAKGYAFQLAMEQMCPSCVNWMNVLQDKVQKLNSHLQNSCQIAQGIVDGGEAAIKAKDLTQVFAKLSDNGIVDDVSDVAGHVKSAKTAWTRWFEADPTEQKKTTGAVVIKALTASSATSWFSGADHLLLEQIMSYTGSHSKGGLINGSEGLKKTSTESSATQGQDPEVVYLPPLPGLSLRVILEGSNGAEIEVYDCAEDPDGDKNRCNIKAGDTKPVKITGLAPRIRETLLGNTSTVAKIYSQSFSADISAQDKKIIGALSGSFGTAYSTIASESPAAAEQFVDEILPAVTLQFAYGFMKEALAATNAAVIKFNSPDRERQLESIKKSFERLERERTELVQQYGQPDKVIERFAAIMDILPAKTYISRPRASQGE
jgi:conjugative transfer pilus assembly protein TraH